MKEIEAGRAELTRARATFEAALAELWVPYEPADKSGGVYWNGAAAGKLTVAIAQLEQLEAVVAEASASLVGVA